MSFTPGAPPTAMSETDAAAIAAGSSSLITSDSGSANNSFEVFRYPSDLASPNYPHWVMFNIVVRKSDLSEAEQKTEISNVGFDASAQNRIPTDNVTAKVTTTAAGAAGGAEGMKNLQGGNVSSTAGTSGAFIGGAVGAAGAGLAGDRTQVLLRKAIALYIPNKPSVSYSAQWKDEDIGIIGGMAKSAQGIAKADSIMGGLSALGGGVSGAAQSYTLQQAEKFDTKGFGNVGGLAEASAGRVTNPFRAQLFKTMGFRTFSFDYSFLPKDESEYRHVQNIIRTFKKYMHPKFGSGSGKFILNYPAEFTITHYYKAGFNPEIFRISNCALSGLQVEYGGSDFTTFKDTPGAPTEISMKLSFTELELLSQERIDAGF